MNWKRNSRDRLGDILEEDSADKPGSVEERVTSKTEDEAEMHREAEDSEPEERLKMKDKHVSIDDAAKEAIENPESDNGPEDGARVDGDVGKKQARWQVQTDNPFDDELEATTERRRTIYELDSYTTSNISIRSEDEFEGGETSTTELDRPRELRYSESTGMPGIARINLSPLTQKIVGCVIGENVTTEYPWIYVRKETIEDNLDLHDESSDFLPVRDLISVFPDKSMLIGYAPSSTEEGQFYICLTEAGRDAVVRNIDSLRIEQEDRVRNAVYKTVGKWKELGSGEEVDDAIVKRTRPLFEIEVESTSDLLNAPIKLIDRNADDRRDGYVELLPYRQTFDNIPKKVVSKGEQACLPLRDNDAQTSPSMSVNSWFQYSYEYKPVNTAAYSEDKAGAMRKFLDKYTDDICDEVTQNATWDIYTNDYANLVRNERDTQPPVPIAYTEHQSYHDGKLSNDKVINDLCWHPLWTGIAVAAYTEHCKSDNLVGPYPHDEVLKACEGKNQVLVWSFNDCLTPKLVLECPREVTAVSVCPHDGNIVVGGCASGQIAVWSIPGKIEQVEAVMVQTTSQVKYKTAMRSLMTWMRESTSSSVVRPAAMSSVQFSQQGPITQIVWLPAHNKIDKNGRIVSLPANASEDELSWQFATASEDGTIAFWDLRWRPTEDKGKAGSRAKRKKTVPRPDPLVQSISAFKALDGTFRPEYMLEVNYPSEERRAVVTTMSILSPKFRKEQTEPFPPAKDDITVRKYYKSVIEKSDYELEPFILIGTVEGDVARLSWEGYEFTTGVIMNRESAKWLWRNSVHDGPVTHAVRSKYLSDVLVTIGGKVFAVWREDVGEPVYRRKATVRYTACCWGTFRPTVLILTRADGTAEIWDFIVKSHEPAFTQGLSGRIITGIYTHELYLNPQCIAFCDFNGTLRVFTAPLDLLTFDVTDIEWMRKYVDREVDRIREFKRWQKSWNEINMENIKMRIKQAELEDERMRLEAEERVKAEMAEMMSKQRLSKAAKVSRKPTEFVEEARDRWRTMELKRMQRVILEKKGLREDVLEKQRAPILKMRQDARQKKRKIRQIMEQRDKIFEDTMALLFPEQYHDDRKTPDLPKLSEYREKDEGPVGAKALLDDQPTTKFRSPEQEIIDNFLEIQSETLAMIKKNPYKPKFEWRKMLCEGNARRRTMDVDLKRSCARKDRRFMREEPDVCEASTDRNRASGYEVWERATGTDETGP